MNEQQPQPETSDETPQSRLDTLLGMFELYASMIEIEYPNAEVQMTLAAVNPDGSGRNFLKFDFAPFAADLRAVIGEPTE